MKFISRASASGGWQLDNHSPFEYWALQYSARQDSDATNRIALSNYSSTPERAKSLWDWKSLSRGIDIDDVRDALTNDELAEFLVKNPGDTVGKLADLLVEHAALANRTVVTPAFLLHRADSDPGQYSIRSHFDVRCWVVYIYLTRQCDGDEPLPGSATQSTARFDEFSAFFQRMLPEPIDGRRYEQALFRFGSYISAVTVDTVSDIDTDLNDLENAVSSMYASDGFELVPNDARDMSD